MKKSEIKVGQLVRWNGENLKKYADKQKIFKKDSVLEIVHTSKYVSILTGNGWQQVTHKFLVDNFSVLSLAEKIRHFIDSSISYDEGDEGENIDSDAATNNIEKLIRFEKGITLPGIKPGSFYTIKELSEYERIRFIIGDTVLVIDRDGVLAKVLGENYILLKHLRPAKKKEIEQWMDSKYKNWYHNYMSLDADPNRVKLKI